MKNSKKKPISRSTSALGSLFLTSTLFSLLACNGLLDVDNPTNLLDDDLTNSKLEETLSNTAEGNLAGPLSYTMRYGGLLTDQYWHPSLQLFGLNLDHGYRHRTNEAVEQMYVDLASGLWIADDMVTRLQEMVDNPDSHLGIAKSYFYGAQARMDIAEYFEEVTYDNQAPITPAEAIADAAERFQKAAQIAAAAGDMNLAGGAYGGMARAYRSLYYEPIALGGSGDLNNMQQAEQWARTALETDPDYRFEAPFGSPGPQNQMSAHARERMTPWYGHWVDPVSGELDPRIPHGDSTVSPSGEVLFRDMKYVDLDNEPLPLSRAAEAELIIAEARYLANDMPGAVEYINKVRSRSNLPPFSSADPDEIWQQFQYERDTELWLEGRRWEDMRYYDIVPVCPGPWTAPTRDQCGEAFLWDQVNIDEGMAARFPIAVQEKGNNPNYPRGG